MSGLAIIDLGYGNTRSVALAFERLGAAPVLTADPGVAASAGKLVLPGVGAAGSAMTQLSETGLADVIRTRTNPTLGICLGMQLFFADSEEDGGTPLLGLLPGTVTAIAPEPGMPVPHMGWSPLGEVAAAIGLVPGDYAYFAHSFACPDGPWTAARTAYGRNLIPAALRHGVYWGAQFHPERSSAAGARFLATFLAA